LQQVPDGRSQGHDVADRRGPPPRPLREGWDRSCCKPSDGRSARNRFERRVRKRLLQGGEDGHIGGAIEGCERVAIAYMAELADLERHVERDSSPPRTDDE